MVQILGLIANVSYKKSNLLAFVIISIKKYHCLCKNLHNICICDIMLVMLSQIMIIKGENMKKKKLSFILNISTICLAIVAIVVGVYSLRQAKLKINGSVGFKAHNCLVTVTGKYKAYTADNLATRTETDLTETKVGGSTESEYSKTLQIPNTLYFSDIATDNNGHEIVFELTITNNSDFEIKVNAPKPTLTKDGTAITDVICASSNTSFKLDKDASQTITLTFTLLDISTAKDIDSTSKFNIALSFEKYVSPYYIQSISEDIYNTTTRAFEKVPTNKLCLTMGHSIVGATEKEAGTDGLTKTPLVWYAFAVKGNQKTGTNEYSEKPTDIFNDTTTTITTPITTTSTYTNSNNETITETWYSLYGVDMSKVTDYKNHTYWFIQQYVVAGGYYINKSDSFRQDGIIFNKDNWSDVTDEEEFNKRYNSQTVYAQVNNDIKSNMYNFLNSESGYVANGFVEKAGLNTDEPVGIESREVNEVYSVRIPLDPTRYITTLTCQFSNKYWLLNYAELGLLCNQTINFTDSTNKYIAYGINNQEEDEYGYGAGWWLRSPIYDNLGRAGAVLHDGSYQSFDIFNSEAAGIRAAFQVQI